MDKNNYSKPQKSLLKKLWRNLSKAFSSEQKSKITLIELQLDKCVYCDSTEVKWKNTVMFDYACEECVPRGCSCTLYKATKRRNFVLDDYKYTLDKDGKELPCEDWTQLH